jgi:teichuronic acid biosynthesis glycosyltransferase TuaC
VRNSRPADPVPRLLFISNLFPDASEPFRGLDNATVLHHLAARWEIRTLALRPALFGAGVREPRRSDARLHPRYLRARYLPKIGSRVNHLLMARALRGPLREMMARSAFDVVLSSWIYPDSCAVARLSRELSFPFVSIAQGSDVHQYLRIPARRRVIAQSMPAASAIITRSADLARLLGEAGVPSDKLHPVYNGIDSSVFQPGDRAAARAALGLPLDRPVVLFVGNFYQIKNPMLLIEALAQVCSDPKLALTKLILIGGGPLEASMGALAARLSLSAKHVVFAGRQDAAGVARYMQAADVLALPSDNEGVPNVILEAFACGLPVVASHVGGIPEVHPGEGFGRLVEPRNLAALSAALRATLSAPPPREVIAAHGQSFTWARTVDAYDQLLRAAMDGAK